MKEACPVESCKNCALIGDHWSLDCRQERQIICTNCNVVGHKRGDCPENKRRIAAEDRAAIGAVDLRLAPTAPPPAEEVRDLPPKYEDIDDGYRERHGYEGPTKEDNQQNPVDVPSSSETMAASQLEVKTQASADLQSSAPTTGDDSIPPLAKWEKQTSTDSCGEVTFPRQSSANWPGNTSQFDFLIHVLYLVIVL